MREHLLSKKANGNRMKVVTYCSGNFTKCLRTTLPSWIEAGCEVTIYTDSVEEVGKAFGSVADVVELTDDRSSNKRVSCMRKIDTIQRAAETFSEGTRFAWLDSDCIVRKSLDEVLHHNQSTVICTRMVHRDYPYKSINAGVSFWRANADAIKFCKEWRVLAEKLKDKENLNEQVAFHKTCYKYYDRASTITVSNVSEQLFNCERDKDDDFRELIKKADPFIVHLKGGRWKRTKDFL